MSPLPKPTPEGYKVYIYRLSNPDPTKFNYADTIKAMIMYSDIRCSEDGITPGYIIVCDSKGFSMSHLTKINLGILRIFMKYIQVNVTFKKNQKEKSWKIMNFVI